MDGGGRAQARPGKVLDLGLVNRNPALSAEGGVGPRLSPLPGQQGRTRRAKSSCARKEAGAGCTAS